MRIADVEPRRVEVASGHRMVTGSGASDLEAARVRRLASTIAPELKARGYAIELVDEVADLDRWRRGARLAAKELGTRIRTGVGPVRVWAVDPDRKPTAEELQRVVLSLDYLE